MRKQRMSSVISCGSSNAAKWPPRVMLWTGRCSCTWGLWGILQWASTHSGMRLFHLEWSQARCQQQIFFLHFKMNIQIIMMKTQNVWISCTRSLFWYQRSWWDSCQYCPFVTKTLSFINSAVTAKWCQIWYSLTNLPVPLVDFLVNKDFLVESHWGPHCASHQVDHHVSQNVFQS